MNEKLEAGGGPADLCNRPGSGPSSPARMSLGSSRFLWVLFVCSLAASLFIHELGHCAVAWVRGYRAVPTPAKEFILDPLPRNLEQQVALGGIIGSVIALLGALFWFNRHPTAVRSALVAGAVTVPGFYALRFILFGRGHDGAEFQEAQAALGLSYAGHALDWIFAGLLVVTTVGWFWRTRPPFTTRFAGRLIAGSAIGLVALVLLQSVNNAVFDRLFE